MSALRPIGTQFRYGNTIYKVEKHVFLNGKEMESLEPVTVYDEYDKEYCDHHISKLINNFSKCGNCNQNVSRVQVICN